MNYLAHAYLSFNIPGILVGNMISDFIKGRAQFDYPEPVQKGIRLHREIDSFTDEHPVTREAKRFFRPAVGLYAGAFVDIVYDHFLALDENEMTAEEWKIFSYRTYKQLESHQPIMPIKFAQLFPHMKQHDWLYNYRYAQGIENSFHGLARRAKYLDGADAAFAVFREDYDELRKKYEIFFPAVKNYVRGRLNEAGFL